MERFLSKLQGQTVKREAGDKIVWKEDNKGVFSVSFFSWEACSRKVLTLDQLQRRGWKLVNRETLLGWHGSFVDRRCIKAWRAAPPCIFWTIWKERNRRFFDCEEVFDQRPTHKAYNILLDAFAISGMVDQARTVFKSMRRDRCTPDICSYTTMLSAYVNASDMEGAEKFFRRLKQDGFEPNVVTYGTLIKGYAKISNLEKMMEKYEEMQEMGFCGVPPDRKATNILLSLAKTEAEKEEANLLVGYSSQYSNGQMDNGSFECADEDDDEDNSNDDDEVE
ncbi:Pentatricopeptide repeat-containing protein [Vitis vinifera]|uniref:Pentatricopeptide repeat-containing protein n=1 Tax=Vitis vinifera TaxID=29760 RepID=A0A438HNB6_VITVI|nr:Pentatricopeptide repeat-containing protein [Vitis vinifera]